LARNIIDPARNIEEETSGDGGEDDGGVRGPLRAPRGGVNR
jgi:hypothetical protein